MKPQRTNRTRKWTWAGFHNWINSVCPLNHFSWSAAYGRRQFTYLISCESENPVQVLHQLLESGSVRRHSMPAISHHHIAVRNTHLLGLIKIRHPFHAQPCTRRAGSTPSSAHGPLNPQPGQHPCPHRGFLLLSLPCSVSELPSRGPSSVAQQLPRY